MTQKIPEQLELRTDWPRAGTGKIVKKSLRDEYRPAGEPTGARRSSRLLAPLGPLGDGPTASSSSARGTSAAPPSLR